MQMIANPPKDNVNRAAINMGIIMGIPICITKGGYSGGKRQT